MKRRLVRDGLSREEFTEERIAALAGELSRGFASPVLSFEERERPRRETLAAVLEGEASGAA